MTRWNISRFTYLMKLSLVVLYNIVGCIHLKGKRCVIFVDYFNEITSFNRFTLRLMGDYKHSMKNKARVEGSIYIAYLHRETTYFCSHYFKTASLLPSTSFKNNPGSYHRHFLFLTNMVVLVESLRTIGCLIRNGNLLTCTSQ